MDEGGWRLDLTRRQSLSLGLGLALGQGQIPIPAQVEAVDETPRLLQNLLTRMAVEVRLPRHQKRLFVIDTGAERSALSDRLAAQLELPAGGVVRVHGITGSAITPTAQLPFLDIFTQRFTDLTLPVFAYDLLAADGLLGLDILAHFRLVLDLRLRRVTIRPALTDSLLPGISTGHATRIRQPLSLANRPSPGQIYVSPLDVGGVAAIGFVDSGAQYSVGNLALMRAVDRTGPPKARNEVRVYGVIGPPLIARADTAEPVSVAQRHLGETPLLFADLHAFDFLGLNARPALLIGADILSRFTRITLDYGRRQIGFGRLLPRPRSP
jgi:hypothetical protein